MRRYLTDFDTNKLPVIKTDVLVVGTGLAGLYASIYVSPEKKCLVVTKTDIEFTSSWLAQGGIAAVISEDDNVDSHVADTLKAGAGLCDEEAVRLLVTESTENIKEMVALNVPFDTNEEGELSITREGGHSIRRIVHCGGDATGRECTRRLGQVALERKNLDFLFRTTLVDIITLDNKTVGALIDVDNEGLKIVLCPNVILATGGIGHNYSHTTNPRGSVGDGIAAAYRAGAKVEKLEMVQFHPTTLLAEDVPERLFLISEAVRGEGGILKNYKGEAFMADKHPLKDLAPRDIVTRFILKELRANPHKCVFLDVSSMSREFFSERFPTIYGKCRDNGVNLTQDLIPVHPAQHYHMGGIKTDLDGQTSVEGLYAIGECACTGIHGANRLASNSMLECLVFGRRAALSANGSTRTIDEDALRFVGSVITPKDKALDRKTANALRDELRSINTRYVGPVRSTEGMKYALDYFTERLAELDATQLSTLWGYELYNMTLFSYLCSKGAYERRESVGAHYIED